jgi:hypothetical protein
VPRFKAAAYFFFFGMVFLLGAFFAARFVAIDYSPLELYAIVPLDTLGNRIQLREQRRPSHAGNDEIIKK